MQVPLCVSFALELVGVSIWRCGILISVGSVIRFTKSIIHHYKIFETRKVGWLGACGRVSSGQSSTNGNERFIIKYHRSDEDIRYCGSK